jgi:hypothetical protein
MPTLIDIAMNQAKTQQNIVDDVVENTIVLGRMPVIEASHQLSHQHKSVESVTGLSLGEDFSPTPTSVDAQNKLSKTDMKFAIGTYYANIQDVEVYGSSADYIAEEFPTILKRSGQNFETNLLYYGLRAKAIADNNYQTMQTSSASTGMYSIIAARLLPQETCLLVNNLSNIGEQLVTVEAMWDGGIGVHPSTGKPVYGWTMYGSLQVLTASIYGQAAIANIDSSNVPGVEELNVLAEQIRVGSNAGSPVMIMNPAVKYQISKSVKFDKIQTSSTDNNVSTIMDSYNNIPILSGYTMASGTEAAESDPS